VNNQFDATVPKPGNLDEKDEGIKAEIGEAPAKIALLLDNFQLRSALAATIELARKGNQYLSEREPWHLLKTDRAETATTLYFATQLVGSLGILISPFLPETAKGIDQQLNLDTTVSRNWWEAGKLRLEAGHKIGKPTPLFHKVSITKP
jgi:methionyl-tRNA synthetase